MYLFHLKKGDFKNTDLRKSFEKYGEDNFEVNILEYCNKEDVKKVKQKWIDKSENTFNKALIDDKQQIIYTPDYIEKQSKITKDFFQKHPDRREKLSKRNFFNGR